MTFKEQLEKEHPELTKEQIENIIDGRCPKEYGYEEWCITEYCEEEECKKCWNREIPSTEQIVANPPMQETLEIIQENVREIPKEEVDMSIVVDKYHEGYDKGMADAWELAKKCWDNSDGENQKIYGTFLLKDILHNLTPQEALAKLKAYEDSKIEVGLPITR